MQAGQKLLDANPNPQELLAAFQGVASERRDDLFETLFKWLDVDPMKDVTQKLIQKLKEGQTGMVSDPKWIGEQVQKLSVNERSFEMALANLRNAGEFAVPIMVDTMRDQKKRNLHGRPGGCWCGWPSRCSTRWSRRWRARTRGASVMMIGVLGEIGYPDAAPYIADRVVDAARDGRSEVGGEPVPGEAGRRFAGGEGGGACS